MPTKHANLVKRLNRESEDRAGLEADEIFIWFLFGILLLVALYLLSGLYAS